MEEKEKFRDCINDILKSRQSSRKNYASTSIYKLEIEIFNFLAL